MAMFTSKSHSWRAKQTSSSDRWDISISCRTFSLIDGSSDFECVLSLLACCLSEPLPVTPLFVLLGIYMQKLTCIGFV